LPRITGKELQLAHDKLSEGEISRVPVAAPVLHALERDATLSAHLGVFDRREVPYYYIYAWTGSGES
jgi:DNA-binding IclR family transcriptional regulator